MTNRFELSLKNKEVRMWIYPALTGSKTPAFISGSLTARKSPTGSTNNQRGM